MQCPNCAGKSAVYGSSMIGKERQRYRRCMKCHHRWKSFESGGLSVRQTVRSHVNHPPLTLTDLLQDDWIDQ